MTASTSNPTYTGIAIDATCRRRMQPRRDMRNGQLVSAEAQSRIASALNQIAALRSREVFRSAGDVTFTASGTTLWRFATHIGPMTGVLVARILCAPANQLTQTNNPKTRFLIANTSGTTIATGTASYGYSYGKTPNGTVDEWGISTIALDVSAYRDTDVRCEIRAQEESLPIAVTVYEVPLRPTTENGYVQQVYSVGSPILDTDRRNLQSLAVSLYKRGASPLIAYSSTADADAPFLASATYANLFPVHFFSGVDSPATWRLDLANCARKTKTTVPVKIECYAGMTAGLGSGNVRLRDLAGNVYATFAISGSAAWQTAQTANLPADLRDYVIEHAGDGANQVNTYSFCVYRYMA